MNPASQLEFQYYHFDELNTRDLYELLRLRQEVFVVEQDCPYLDADGKDYESYHLMGRDSSGHIQAYTRLVPKGISYENYASIGRVVTSQAVRGQGLGKMLMHESLEAIRKLFPEEKVKISAQCYLIPFYESLGFQVIGEEYLEDNIPHIGMILADEL
jgi:ElaA protein